MKKFKIKIVFFYYTFNVINSNSNLIEVANFKDLFYK